MDANRHCAGLSKVNFETAKLSNLPFYCPCCLLAEKSKELIMLKDLVDNLVSEISNLKSAYSSVMSKIESSTSAPTMVPSTAHSQTSLLPSAPLPVVIRALLYNVNNTWSR